MGRFQLDLVYADAITENITGKVNIHPITYELNGIKIAANVYTPADYDASKKYPAVTVGNPNGGVKEQIAGLFAQKLAEAGYITVAADAAYQGEMSMSSRKLTSSKNFSANIFNRVKNGLTARPLIFLPKIDEPVNKSC